NGINFAIGYIQTSKGIASDTRADGNSPIQRERFDNQIGVSSQAILDAVLATEEFDSVGGKDQISSANGYARIDAYKVSGGGLHILHLDGLIKVDVRSVTSSDFGGLCLQ